MRYALEFHHKTDGVGVVMAIVATVIFLGSVFVHELAHAVVARRRGMAVTGITLYIFGGATSAGDPKKPGDEFLMTAAGPLVNFVAALVLWGITIAATHGHLAEVAEVSGEAAWLNLLLGAFNIVPASPLDGGHLLEAVAWRVKGSRPKAILIAAGAGTVLGWLLLAAGFFELLFVTGGLFEGLWIGLIGFMLLEGARSEKMRGWVEGVLENKPAWYLLTEHAAPVTPETSIGWLIGAELVRHHVDAVPVVDSNHVAGVVLAQDALSIPPAERFGRVAKDVMRPVTDLPWARASGKAMDVLRQLAEHPIILLVDDRGGAVGVVSERQVGAVLERLRLLDQRGGQPRSAGQFGPSGSWDQWQPGAGWQPGTGWQPGSGPQPGSPWDQGPPGQDRPKQDPPGKDPGAG